MDGQINHAYVIDHGEGLDYGSLDDTLDIQFYRSKLVIDFSKETTYDEIHDSHRAKQITKKVEFETSHKSPNIFFQNSPDKERNANNPLHIITKRNQYCLICLYGFGLLVISIGIILLVAGSINNSIDETVGT